MGIFNRKLIAASITTVVFVVTAAVAQARDSNKWRVEFDERAKSDGEIVLRITPTGATPMDVTILVKDGTGENDIAKAVVKALKEQLPEDGYHVERDDGEDVLIKKKGGAANFTVEVVSNTAKDVDIDLDRE